MNEFELIARYWRRPARSASVALGIGDDAALLMPSDGCQLVASVDMLVSGRHFFVDADPETLGHKSLAVNLSDMAAMGATPKWALLALALAATDATWLVAFERGFRALADEHGVDIVGGDTTRGPLNICVTILGEVPMGEGITRSGAKADDDIYVSGSLGDAALAVRALEGETNLDADAFEQCRNRLDRPAPRIELGQRLRRIATSMLDVSDGLTGDLGHILASSNVGAVLDLSVIPRSPVLGGKLSGSERDLALRCLLAGGDDYELCFTAPPSARERVDAIAVEVALPLTRIGRISAEPGLIVHDERGERVPQLPRAYDHFAEG